MQPPSRPSFEAVLEAYAAARRHLGETLSAVEFLDRASMELVLEHLPGARDPLAAPRCAFYMLVELSGSSAAHDGEKLHSYLEAAMGDGAVLDGTVAMDSAQADAIWAIRESIRRLKVPHCPGRGHRPICPPGARRLRPPPRTSERSLGVLGACSGLSSPPQAAPRSRAFHFLPPGTSPARSPRADRCTSTTSRSPCRSCTISSKRCGRACARSAPR